VPPPPPKRPVDELRNLAAPHELIEWVRKLPPESAARSAWVDAPRADWLPYLALLRGIQRDHILRAVCECAVESAGVVEGPEFLRVIGVLREGTTRGREAFSTVEADFADLRLVIIANQGRNTTAAPWMAWSELVLELARAARMIDQPRGNPMVGISLALKMLATVKGKGKGSRPAHTDLVARLRDKLTLAS
jgi:hypothetical protein